MTDTITIPVNQKAAQLYRAASDEQRLKIQVLLSFFLENPRPSPDALLQRMDAMSDQAEARGLTPELLEASMSEIITLTPYLKQWVEARVQSGRYSDASDVLREALRLLEQHEREREARVRDLQAAPLGARTRDKFITTQSAEVQAAIATETQRLAEASHEYGTLGALLDAPVAWAGDDLEECLSLVYATRTPVEF